MGCNEGKIKWLIVIIECIVECVYNGKWWLYIIIEMFIILYIKIDIDMYLSNIIVEYIYDIIWSNIWDI